MISCKEYVTIKKKELKEKIKTFDREPVLAVVQIDNDPASCSYVRGKKKDCEEVGIKCVHIPIDSNKYSQKELEQLLTDLSENKTVDGIILQLPIPKKKYNVEVLQNCICSYKDVDGFRKDSCFKPCTPKGIIDWLKYNDFDFVGKDVVVLGRSKIVGKPLVNMLIDEGATVTCCNSHSYTPKYTSYADLVISAIGKPKYFETSNFRNVDIIVDVGINRDEDGKLCGDINTEHFAECLPFTYITPVPGGVGLLTRETLLENTVKAYELNRMEDKK